MHDEAVLALLTSMEAIDERHQILKNGKHTLLWVDLVKVLQFPDIVKDFGEQIVELFFDEEFDVVVSASVTGMAIGQEVSKTLEIRHVFAEEKDGKMIIRDSFKFEKGEKALVIDDVVASGTSLREVVKILKDKGVSVKSLVCVVDRADKDEKFKPKLQSLLALRLPMYEADECEKCKGSKPEKAAAKKPAAKKETAKKVADKKPATGKKAAQKKEAKKTEQKKEEPKKAVKKTEKKAVAKKETKKPAAKKKAEPKKAAPKKTTAKKTATKKK